MGKGKKENKKPLKEVETKEEAVQEKEELKEEMPEEKVEKVAEVKCEKSALTTTIIVAIIVAVLSSLATLVIVKKFVYKNNNIVGDWYNTYADKVFVLTLKKDKTFEYGYEGEDKTTGKYTNSNDVITLKTDAGETNLVYGMEKGYIEIDSTKYYNDKKEAAKNDGFYFIPEDYDTSMFTAITPDEFVKKFKNGETAFVLFARGSCGYCQQFRPIAAESLKKYNYKLYYLNTTQLKDENIETIQALDSKLDSITSTPSVYYIKGKKVVDIQSGYTDLETYGSFLKKNGVKAK